jgi:antitoxin CptB
VPPEPDPAGGDAGAAPGAPPPRLLWRCRRGTRELDLLLSAWVARHWQAAAETERAAFAALLEEQDPDLLDWLSGRAAPPARYAALVHALAGRWADAETPGPGADT